MQKYNMNGYPWQWESRNGAQISPLKLLREETTINQDNHQIFEEDLNFLSNNINDNSFIFQGNQNPDNATTNLHVNKQLYLNSSFNSFWFGEEEEMADHTNYKQISSENLGKITNEANIYIFNNNININNNIINNLDNDVLINHNNNGNNNNCYCRNDDQNNITNSALTTCNSNNKNCITDNSSIISNTSSLFDNHEIHNYEQNKRRKLFQISHEQTFKHNNKIKCTNNHSGIHFRSFENSLYRILPMLSNFKPKYTKRENIDKKTIRKFRQFVVELNKHKKFKSEEQKHSNFWILLINGDLFPPVNFFDTNLQETICFKSLNSSYLLWFFSKTEVKEMYDKFITVQGRNYIDSLIKDYKIRDEIDKNQLDNYISNLPNIFDKTLLDKNNYFNTIHQDKYQDNKDSIKDIQNSNIINHNLNDYIFDQATYPYSNIKPSNKKEFERSREFDDVNIFVSENENSNDYQMTLMKMFTNKEK